MNIESIKILWNESKGFMLERKNIGDQYIFLYFPTPVDIYTTPEKSVKVENSFIIYDKYSYQKMLISYDGFVHNYMHITGNMDHLMNMSHLNYNTIYEIPNGDFITIIMRDLELEHLNHDEYSISLMEHNFKRLFLLLGRYVNTPNRYLINSKNKEILLDARSHIHQNYFEKWTIDSMAAYTKLSPSRFCELYNKFFKISPKKDLQNIRIQRAKDLLENSSLSVKEIAELIGYDNEYYFIRKFKQATGKTPGKYIKKIFD